MNIMYQILFFGCLGITIEVLFTALKKTYQNTNKNTPIDRRLEWKSYVWMFVIYWLIPIVAPIIYKNMSDYWLVIRLLVYALIIICFEYICWFIIKQIIWKSPWYYTNWLHIHNLVRIDYIPLWMCFSYLIEHIYIYISQL